MVAPMAAKRSAGQSDTRARFTLSVDRMALGPAQAFKALQYGPWQVQSVFPATQQHSVRQVDLVPPGEYFPAGQAQQVFQFPVTVLQKIAHINQFPAAGPNRFHFRGNAVFQGGQAAGQPADFG